jgi:peroxiredoxin
LAEYARRLDELEALGYGLAALSVDPPERSRALAAQLGLRFVLLCDPSREAVQRFGVYNRDEKGGIAYPATFVLDRERVVRFRSLDRTAARVNLDGLFDLLRQGANTAAPCNPARCTIVPTLHDWARMVLNGIRYGVRSPRS